MIKKYIDISILNELVKTNNLITSGGTISYKPIKENNQVLAYSV